jgi:4a-hydroxytetrahydrobiopterin dehydratase
MHQTIKGELKGVVMSDLCNLKCEACREGAPKVTNEEILLFKTKIPEWSILDVEGVSQVQRKYKFKNFAQAIEFTDQVGAVAEENGHHPSILTEWGKVTVTYWTHKIKGLHKSDFIMAAKTDKLYGG